MFSLFFILLIWIILGLHCSYYFIRSFTVKYVLTTHEIPIILICFMLPVICHIAVYIEFDKGLSHKKKK